MTQTIKVSEIPVPDFIKGPDPKGMLIGGQWTQAQSAETFQTVNPATGSVLATIASGGAADVDRAVAAARRAFEKPSWADMNPHERTLVLLRIADAIEANGEELATLESLDGGIPITLTRGMVADAAKTVRYYAG
ncbi:MAG TPA: aldehyde dehydrogenase family protein, partial [Streptosporangiaceae bacterium]|nr:aldehyde dehydrogenase family protein [Streptosporangiaceae bacterium]